MRLSPKSFVQIMQCFKKFSGVFSPARVCKTLDFSFPWVGGVLLHLDLKDMSSTEEYLFSVVMSEIGSTIRLFWSTVVV